MFHQANLATITGKSLLMNWVSVTAVSEQATSSYASMMQRR
jgi:hypothetical protein